MFKLMSQTAGGWSKENQTWQRHVAALALIKFEQNQLESPAHLRAIYVRPSDAELKRTVSTPKPTTGTLLAGLATDQMSEHDLLEVVEIEERSGLSRWGWAAYYAELQGVNRSLMLVARLANSETPGVAGYIVCQGNRGEELHINNVAVREEYRRQGIGCSLLNCILEEGRRLRATTAFLEVRAGNLAARALYERCGFRAVSPSGELYSELVRPAMSLSDSSYLLDLVKLLG